LDELCMQQMHAHADAMRPSPPLLATLFRAPWSSVGAGTSSACSGRARAGRCSPELPPYPTPPGRLMPHQLAWELRGAAPIPAAAHWRGCQPGAARSNWPHERDCAHLPPCGVVHSSLPGRAAHIPFLPAHSVAPFLNAQEGTCGCLGGAEGPASEESGSVVRPRVWLGACAVDVATGQMLVGQWMDDDMRSQARDSD
jgi:hypothetical protein